MLPDIARLLVEGVGLGSARILLGSDPVPAATYGDPSTPETVLEPVPRRGTRSDVSSSPRGQDAGSMTSSTGCWLTSPRR